MSDNLQDWIVLIGGLTRLAGFRGLTEKVGFVLEGRRLTLRAIETEDLPVLWKFNNNVDLAGLPPLPQSFSRLESQFRNQLAQSTRDNPWFAIVVEGEVAGQCGLTGLKESQHRAYAAELGIQIGNPSYRGKGYGRDAVDLLLDYAFTYWNIERVGLKTDDDNVVAIRCFTACGFVEEGRIRRATWVHGRFQDQILMGILRQEWESAVRTLRTSAKSPP